MTLSPIEPLTLAALGSSASQMNLLLKTLNFARRMEPFVERARLTGKHYDVGDVTAINVVERCRKGMNQIFLGRKFLKLEAKWAIRETFSIAVTYKLETRRRQQRVLKQKAQEIQILKNR